MIVVDLIVSVERKRQTEVWILINFRLIGQEVNIPAKREAASDCGEDFGLCYDSMSFSSTTSTLSIGMRFLFAVARLFIR